MFLRTTPSSAFTLIELLIVVAIISILASIAVPNFLEAQTRAKVARAQNDLRTVAVALEMYQVDNNTYPTRTKVPAAAGVSGVGDIELRMEEMSRLTSPLAYISSLPTDIFVPTSATPSSGGSAVFTHDDMVLFDYWDEPIIESVSFDDASGNEKSRIPWAMMSQGPDMTLGLGGNWGNMPPPAGPELGSYKYDYDATNGTISAGNVYRFPSTIPAHKVF